MGSWITSGKTRSSDAAHCFSTAFELCNGSPSFIVSFVLIKSRIKCDGSQVGVHAFANFIHVLFLFRCYLATVTLRARRTSF